VPEFDAYFLPLTSKKTHMEILTIESIDTIHDTARQFVDRIGDRTVFAFNGKM